MARDLTADIRLDELRFRITTYRHEHDTPATSESDGSTNSSMMCQSVISEGPDSLISSFNHLGYLRILNLTHNNIGSEGITTRSHLLPFLTSIEELHSSNNNISSEGATILSSSLQYLSTLKCLHLF